MKRRIALSIASVALCLGGLVVAQAGAATKTVSASGGSVTLAATVRSAKTCGWSSSPKIAGFATTVKCKSGTVARSVRFTANTSSTAKSYSITLVVHGKSTTVTRWKVNQAGESPPTTTSTSTSTTTTTVPPAPGVTISVSVLAYQPSLGEISINGVAKVGEALVFAAQATGNAGPIPSTVLAGYKFTFTGPAQPAPFEEQSNWAAFTFTEAGTYVVHVTFFAGTAGQITGPYVDVSGEIDYQVVVS